MIIAQTELTSPLSPTTSTSDDSISNGLSWLLPIAIGIAFGIWFLRRKSRPSEQKASPKLATKERPRTKSSPNLETEGIVDRVRSNKKKKKNRSNSSTSEKTVTASPSIATKSKKRVASEQPTSYAPTISPSSEPAITRSVPIEAIFEPLRDVGALRRSGNPEKARDESKAKPNSEVVATRSVGVKFERTINHTATTQSVANRWADSQPRLQPPKLSTIISSPLPKVIPIPMVNDSPAPSQGLKSFVSKVKAVAANDSDAVAPNSNSSANPTD